MPRRRAFTLIELLVVIAVVAILAAILFPVLASAKTSAKKTVSISNQKNIGLALIGYSSDSDDVFPREDDCRPGSALNPALRGAEVRGDGCSRAPFFNRTNHPNWQRWVAPYTKTTDLFRHPVITPYDGGRAPNRPWTDGGQIRGGYALNMALTGTLNAFDNSGEDPTYRDSFLGGTTTAVPRPSETMIMMELNDTAINYVPAFLTGDGSRATSYPFAVREMWRTSFYKRDTTRPGCRTTNVIDPRKVPFSGTVPLSFVDGHTKAISVGAFLAATPTADDYRVTSRPVCGLGAGMWAVGETPMWTGSWPMWGLEE